MKLTKQDEKAYEAWFRMSDGGTLSKRDYAVGDRASSDLPFDAITHGNIGAARGFVAGAAWQRQQRQQRQQQPKPRARKGRRSKKR